MGFKKISASLVLLILVIMPMFLALDTPIQVKTQPNYVVTIRALDINGKGTLEGGAFLDQIADANGIVKVTFSSDLVNKIDISLMIKNSIGGTMVQFAGGPVQVLNNRGEHIKTGWPVEIDTSANPPVLVKSGKPAGAVEESASDNSNINSSDTNSSVADNSLDVSLVIEDNKKPEQEIQETNKEVGAETKTGTTGKVISISKSFLTSKITYSVIGILILVLVIGFVFKNKLINLHLPEFKHSTESKKSEFKVLPRESPKLRDAERKLDQAKKEIDEIRNRNSSLQEARKRLEADKRELERLERD